MNIIDLNEVLDSRFRLTPLLLPDEARSEIVSISCGLPYYTQLLGKLVAQNALRRRRIHIQIDDIDAAMEDFLIEGGEAFEDDYRQATDSPKQAKLLHELFLASALADSDVSGDFSISDVLRLHAVIAPSRSLHPLQVQRYLSQLISDKRGMVLKRSGVKSGYRYRFSDALMQPFVIIRGIKDGLIDQQLRRVLFQSKKLQGAGADLALRKRMRPSLV